MLTPLCEEVESPAEETGAGVEVSRGVDMEEMFPGTGDRRAELSGVTASLGSLQVERREEEEEPGGESEERWDA